MKSDDPVRRAIVVSGLVQGVGFRAFVFGLATRHGLGGFVRNQTDGVYIEAEGVANVLDRFMADLRAKPPPRARIEHIASVPQPARGETTFRIEASVQATCGIIFIQPDIGTCANCLKELFDHADRRYRYPFLNCCDCGPRLTIIKAAPYDRAQTTMAAFTMCADCQIEYDDPCNRRFHAQPIACPVCGPRLKAVNAHGEPIDADPLGFAVEALRRGEIVAIKGLGGYHLACLAESTQAVTTLRARKARDEKPFALMVADIQRARELCEITTDEERLLMSFERPIVLLRRLAGISIAEAVAPGNTHLGITLPYTPLHHLLLHDLGGAPLVMTSGNRSDEPIAFDDADALARLGDIVECFLTHNRPIHLRCDDSVTRVAAGGTLPIRRSRGYAPEPIRLPMKLAAPTLALGGQLKATFALGQHEQAFLSHHLGDLDHYEAYRAYVEAIEHYQRLWAIEPEQIVHDMHPDYASTRYAQTRRCKLLGVQHHHAHLASCMAEHGLQGEVIGVIFDGTGYGTDGAIWGGEFLVGDYRKFERAATFRPVPMPGGEQAIREPWRMALAHLQSLKRKRSGLEQLFAHASGSEGRIVEQMLERGINAPLTSSVGRLFDAVASLAGVRQTVSYEGQAAMELEWLASSARPEPAYPFEITPGGLQSDKAAATLHTIDCRPMIESVLHDAGAGAAANMIARRFHETLIAIILDMCGCIRQQRGLDRVVLSGGVFMNVLLLEGTMTRLTGAGFHVYTHRLVPPNDGGLALGQLAIAAASHAV